MSDRFSKKRERIIDAASILINRNGLKGLTFVDVAEQVELSSTSVTYYFKRKEFLAAAAFKRAIERLDSTARNAETGTTARERVRMLLRTRFDYWQRVRKGEDRPFVSLADMRALEEPLRTEVITQYKDVVARLAGFFDAPKNAREAALNHARGHVLMETSLWLAAWIHDYSQQDFERVEERMFEVLEKGLAIDGGNWTPELLNISEKDPEKKGGAELFLGAATRLMNQLGYHGASVERIVASLNVTKGSFYHHLNAKDDLVLSCFERSYDRVSFAQRIAIETGENHWKQLTSVIATLLDIQFGEQTPLLRTTALAALPGELRGNVLNRSNRLARRFAGMIIDGVSEGTIRAVDPLIASQMIMSMLNTAFDQRAWAEDMSREDAVHLYASTLTHGLFAPVPE